MKHHFGGAAAVAAVAVLLFSSCGGQQPGSGGSGSESWGTAPQQPPRTTTPHSSSSPVPSPSKPQPSETFTPEQLEAANVLIEYYRIRDAVVSDLTADPQPLMDITIGQSREIDMNLLTGFRERGQVQKGTTVVHITGASEPVEFDGVRSVDVQMCTDAAKTEMIDSQTGKSVREVGQWSPYLQWNVTVVKTETGWKFGDATNESVGWCPL